MNTKIGGVLVCAALAVIATMLGGLQHFMGGPMIGLLLGMLIMNLVPVGDKFLKGAKFCSKPLLNLAIVLAGGTLDLHQIMGTGGTAMPMLSINICISLLVAHLIGKKMQVTANTSTLIGSGTAICGGTAIATTATIIQAKEAEIAYAMAAIFFFDVIGALVFPYWAAGAGLSNQQMGFLIGGAVNDMSSVAAAEATFNALTGQDLNIALTVKLTRTTLLIPVALLLSAFVMHRQALETPTAQTRGAAIKKIIPWAVVGFIVMALLNTLGVFGAVSGALTGSAATLGSWLKTSYKFLTTVALCGVGFKIKVKELLTKGIKPVLLGGVTWLSITAFVLFYIFVILR